MTYQAHCTACHWRGATRDSYGLAVTDATVHEHRHGSTEVLAVCPNCGQWRHSGDCLNDCADRGFAPKASAETLNL